MRLGYIVLAHRDPNNIARLATRLAESGATVVIHYDLKCPVSEFQQVRSALEALSDRVVFAERIAVGWGQWSMVQATLNALHALAATGWTFDYVHLMSGMDYPIKPLHAFEAFLEQHSGTEFIEATNIRIKAWVKGGLEHERYQYHHAHNWQTQREKFDRYWAWQKRRGKKRAFLPGLAPHLGSQWWTLTWSTCLGALRWSQAPGVTEFFRSVWIPDEMFFQTFVGNNVRPSRIFDAALTLYHFNDKGIPTVFYNDHLDYLIQQQQFFARKLSPYADHLRDGLDRHVAQSPAGIPSPEADLPPPRALLQETIERHRWGLPNRRRIGHAADWWYGDLEWNRHPYLVLMAQSSSAVARIRGMLSRLEGLTCHGELFAGDEIQFVGGLSAFAGYRSDDVDLRDHSRRNFLVDIISHGAPALTCFVLVMHGVDDFKDVLIWDRRAHFVLVESDLVEDFLDDRRGRLADGGAEAGAAEFAAFAKTHLSNRREVAAMAEALAKAGKKSLSLKTFERDWEERLTQYVADIRRSTFEHNWTFARNWEERLIQYVADIPRSTADAAALAIPPSYPARATAAADRPSPSGHLRLLSAIPDEAERRRRLGAYFNAFGDRADRCVVAFVHSAADAKLVQAMARAAPYLEWVTVVYGPRDAAAVIREDAGRPIDARPGRDARRRAAADGAGARGAAIDHEVEGTAPDLIERSGLAELIVLLDFVSISSERYHIAGAPFVYAAPLIEMLVADPRAHLLIARGNLFAALADFVDAAEESGWAEASTEALKPLLRAIARGADDFVDRIQAMATGQRKQAVHLDLLALGWFGEFIAALKSWSGEGAGGHLDEEEIAGVLRRELASWRDPTEAFDDALELTRAIEPAGRRAAHQRIVTSSSSAAKAAKSARIAARAGLRVLSETAAGR